MNPRQRNIWKIYCAYGSHVKNAQCLDYNLLDRLSHLPDAALERYAGAIPDENPIAAQMGDQRASSKAPGDIRAEIKETVNKLNYLWKQLKITRR